MVREKGERVLMFSEGRKGGEKILIQTESVYRKPKTLASVMAERQCLGWLDTWPFNWKQTPSFVFCQVALQSTVPQRGARQNRMSTCHERVHCSTLHSPARIRKSSSWSSTVKISLNADFSAACCKALFCSRNKGNIEILSGESQQISFFPWFSRFLVNRAR